MKDAITPLPWRVDHGMICVGEAVKTDRGTLRTVIAAMHGTHFAEQCKANANYIVRAANAYPDMVKALELAIDCLERGYPPAGGWTESVIKECKQALARGERGKG